MSATRIIDGEAIAAKVREDLTDGDRQVKKCEPDITGFYYDSCTDW